MKHLLTYIKKEELRHAKWYILISIALGLMVTLAVFIIRTVTAKEGSNVIHFELAGSVPFFFAMFFFGVNVTSRVYRVHMQFGVSRKSALKVLLFCSFLFALICAVLGMALDGLYSVIFDTEYMHYGFETFASDFKLIENDQSVKFLFLSFIFNYGFYLAVLFAGMMFVVMGYFLPPRVGVVLWFTIYFCILFGSQYIEGVFGSIWSKLGAGLSITLLISGILVIELTVIILLYRRICFSDKQLVT